ncbi:MAG: PhoH family protein [Halieaceae bacterium]|nr:PhoH family protein [Halieaceae bacterium]
MTQLADTSDPSSQTISSTLEPNNATYLAILCGQFDAHLKQIEQRLNVAIASRGNRFSISGATEAREAARDLLENLYRAICRGEGLSAETLHVHMQDAGLEVLKEQRASEAETTDNVVVIKTKRAPVKPRGKNQQGYVRAIQDFDINFGIGPAGTGKTYLAVACGVEALLNDRVRRILLVRPAVEAGEKLGFLPGDLAQKIDPYLRPLYDALYEMLGFEQVNKYIERNIIEVAPLAFMRGRTLNNAFIILDEAQNTTREQMKMFLTRIGFGSTAVITGDATQIDLPRGAHSGLTHASHILDGVDGISFTYFANKDVVRHPLVQRVVEAYDRAELAPSKIESNSR